MPPLILASGAAEHTMRMFWRYVPIVQATTAGEQVSEFGRTLNAFCRRHRLLYLFILVCLSIIAHIGFRYAANAGLLARWINLAGQDQLSFVFDGALLAYGFLGLGLFNCMFCITVGRPQAALQAVQWGMVILIGSGLPLALVSYQYTVLAFI